MGEVLVRSQEGKLQVLAEGGHNVLRSLGVEDATLHEEGGKVFATVTFEVTHLAGERVGAGLAAALKAAELAGIAIGKKGGKPSKGGAGGKEGAGGKPEGEGGEGGGDGK